MKEMEEVSPLPGALGASGRSRFDRFPGSVSAIVFGTMAFEFLFVARKFSYLIEYDRLAAGGPGVPSQGPAHGRQRPRARPSGYPKAFALTVIRHGIDSIPDRIYYGI